ncbi:hypothetical protein ACFO1B_15005 [Dactylosporangium siamense]|uniref:Uncharacterized protein n=1 Tax=Dactylosporangium siamense TaxID=685454 RepID=A0A919PJ76_9ACTN|nr:hypothetical protein [Dactylosporangium siamense]GIG45142.1 hypothetical protein Dsi01nite_031830 [Dactylosporangium siamense]
MAGWLTVVGTLGGVLVTAAVGLITAMLSHRWQQERLRLEQRFASERELRATRREVYARYLVTAQRLFDTANTLHRQRSEAPLDLADVIARPPAELRGPLTDNETVRVETMLLATGPVREVLDTYDRALWNLLPRMASGTDRAGQPECTKLYHQLVQAMHAEIHGDRPERAQDQA